MNYRIAVGIYCFFYVLSVVLLSLFFGAGLPVFQLIVLTIPILLVGPRLAGKQPLVPEEFKSESGLLYGAGNLFVWLGHLLFFGSIAAGIWFAATGQQGAMLVGLVTGRAMFPYLLGILLVEVAFRLWSAGRADQSWQAQQMSVYVVVGLVVAAHLALAVLNFKPGRQADLLSFSEREALARGTGYAREVQRATERFYVSESRMPCINDKHIDVNSLLRDMRDKLSMELLDCGRFTVTIHDPVDGVSGRPLLYVASPGDVSAGQPLNWHCISADHERIERHTNGKCTYDKSFADAM